MRGEVLTKFYYTNYFSLGLTESCEVLREKRDEERQRETERLLLRLQLKLETIRRDLNPWLFVNVWINIRLRCSKCYWRKLHQDKINRPFIINFLSIFLILFWKYEISQATSHNFIFEIFERCFKSFLFEKSSVNMAIVIGFFVALSRSHRSPGKHYLLCNSSF